ncbi:antistasin-like [Asterias rubens]|uniref:antistasin-like n=1 Tax=Asterias rubens TaxID=7604 RepID=UPI001455A58B|nr:antistasin-like [Asterias rubens]UVH36233.1 sea star footprint protein 15 [Asterias rubens]
MWVLRGFVVLLVIAECLCRSPPFMKMCPVVPEDVGGICVEECGPDKKCDDGQLCCSNGCGHVCKAACPPLICGLTGCLYGRVTDENGCETCSCRGPPAVCPKAPEGVFGICVEECGPNKKCDDGQLCCPNGCGHVCKAGCAPVLCRMGCRNGWATDEDGCEICQCKRPAQ